MADEFRSRTSPIKQHVKALRREAKARSRLGAYYFRDILSWKWLRAYQSFDVCGSLESSEFRGEILYNLWLAVGGRSYLPRVTVILGRLFARIKQSFYSIIQVGTIMACSSTSFRQSNLKETLQITAHPSQNCWIRIAILTRRTQHFVNKYKKEASKSEGWIHSHNILGFKVY